MQEHVILLLIILAILGVFCGLAHLLRRWPNVRRIIIVALSLFMLFQLVLIQAVQRKALYCCADDIETTDPHDAFLEGVDSALDYTANWVLLAFFLNLAMLAFALIPVVKAARAAPPTLDDSQADRR